MNQEEEIEDDLLYEHHRLVADVKQQAMRIDKFLMARLSHVTRTKLQQGIRNGFIKVAQQVVKPNYIIRPHDVVTVSLPHPPRNKEIKPENIPLSIVHEDESLLIVDKPAGMVVHPAHQHWEGTLVNALAYRFQHLPELSGRDNRPGLVHRIDKNTSGLLVVAKTEEALVALAKQFYDHTIERTYWALAWGLPSADNDTISTRLARSHRDRRVMEAFGDDTTRGRDGVFRGKLAITHYSVLQSLRYVSLLSCRLETGRTHQIRAHMQYIGHPLFNDAVYGGNRILEGELFAKYKQFVQNCFEILPRQALHAKTLGFIHPLTKQYVHYESELPDDFQALIDKWKHYVKYT